MYFYSTPMKKANFIVLIFFCLSLGGINAQVTKTVYVPLAGQLSNLLTEEEKSTITHLIVTGNINPQDLKVMDNMLHLSKLDLTDANIAKIPAKAFWGCSLISVNLPTSITSYDPMAFMDCSYLDSINISSDNLKFKSINGVLFSKNQEVIIHFPPNRRGNYTIPVSVTEIGEKAFYDCNVVNSIILPASLTIIKNAAFYQCFSIQSISLPYWVTSIGDSAFYGCGQLRVIKIPPLVTTIGRYTFKNCYASQSITIPNTVTQIMEGAFMTCNLNTVSIPSSVTYIGSGAFAGNISISKFIVNENNTNYCSVDGILFNKDTTMLMAFPSETGGRYTFPSTVTSMDAYAFNLSKLTSVTLSSVNKIPAFAFKECYQLTSITIPSSVDSIEISAFENCHNLNTVVIASSVSYIGDYVFNGCNKLKSIRAYSSTPTSFNYYGSTFTGVNKADCHLFVPTGSKSAYASANLWKNFINIEEFDFALSLSDTSLFVDIATGNATHFNIVSNTEWNISTDQPWLSFGKTSGSENGMITLTAETNPNSTARTATITVAGTGITSQTIRVTQAVNTMTGTTVMGKETIRLYPNPVSDFLFIDGAAHIEARIYTIQGTLLLTKTLENDHETIDFSTMQSGLYLVKVGDKTSKVMK